MKMSSPGRVMALLCSFLLTASSVAGAPSLADLAGTWKGNLELPRRSLPLVLHITKVQNGLEATLDSPAQGATGIPVANLSLSESTFSFSAPTIAGRYEGTIDSNGEEIRGTWSQGAVVAPLNFRRAGDESDTDEVIPPSAAKRPQTPKAPFPYLQEEISFPSLEDGITLSGTLTRPKGKGPFSAVVLITGSGPQDRNESVAGHKPFLVIADFLTRDGMAVLRFDDRGVGASKGDFPRATTHDFAKDAAGALKALRARPEIDAKHAGYLGHSEGGVVAVLAHDRYEPANFLALLSTPVLPYSEYILDQVRALALAAGASPEAADAKVAAQKRIIDAALSGTTPEESREAVERALISLGAKPALAKNRSAVFGSPWMFSLLRLDPRTALGRVRVPLLGLWGSKDVQVDAAKNSRAAKAVLSQNPDTELHVLTGLNHILQPANTGGPDEYASIETTIAPAALMALSSWLMKLQ